MITVPFNFLGLPAAYSGYEKSRYVVLPIPYDGTVSFRSGSREGPLAIIAASRQVELFDPLLDREIFLPGVATVDPVEAVASSAEEMVEGIYKHVRKIVRDGKFLISLGGEHSITSGLVKAVREKYKKVSVLHVDAHLDMRDKWQGSRYSHACVMRRIHEFGVKTVSVGIRNISQEENRYVNKTRQVVFTAWDIRLSGSDEWIEDAVKALGEEVYLSIDIDGFDPSIAPGTGTPEPGGLDWYDIIKLLTAVSRSRRIVGADIVEVLPIGGQVVTEFLAAKLGAKIIALTQK